MIGRALDSWLKISPDPLICLWAHLRSPGWSTGYRLDRCQVRSDGPAFGYSRASWALQARGTSSDYGLAPHLLQAALAIEASPAGDFNAGLDRTLTWRRSVSATAYAARYRLLTAASQSGRTSA